MSSGKSSSQSISLGDSANNNGNNFYDVCIQAIESNNDRIINKEECIRKINKLKNKSQTKNQKSNQKVIKKIDKKPQIMKSVTQKCIDELLEESNNRIKKEEKTEEINFENNDIEEQNNNNILNNNSKEKNNLNMFFKGKQRRYTVLKHINEYLESNDVTLNELIDNNPFQDKPYEIPGSYEFIEAVKFGNFDYVNDALMKDSIFLFCIDYYGQTGYHWAAKLGNIKMLELLIQYGRHHNQKDFKGRTPLYLAAFNNKTEVCKYLLANGANPFLRDKMGKTSADVAGTRQLSEFLKDNMAQPFSNPVYKAKMKKILQDRANHLFKEGQRTIQKKSTKKICKIVDKVIEEKNNNN